jgi:SAM-dependent methyltransferase
MTPTVDEIKKYWDRKAKDLSTDPIATMKDVILRSLEIEAVASWLFPEDTLLDVGCGNAFGSLIFAEHCKSVLAVDYSEKMVAMAHKAIRASDRDNIHVERGDVLEVGRSYPEAFSAVSSIRCLINLPEEEQQYHALSQLAQVLVPGGRLFLIEGIAEHFATMNAMRQQVGLYAIPLDWHNRLFAKAALESALSELFTTEEIVDFGEYYFLSRIVHPLLVAPAEPTFDGELNFVAKTIWRSGVVRGMFAFMSTLLLYVCRRH